MDAGDVCRYWETDPAQGLSPAAVRGRQARFGPNRLEEGRQPSPLAGFLRQFQDVVVWVLLAAAGVSLYLGERADAVTIAAIVLINAFLGFLHESRAERALQALERLTAPEAVVLRGGLLQQVDAAQLVPGDIIEVNGGDRVPADARLISGTALEVDEAALTGESVPVTKDAGDGRGLPEDTPLGDRSNMLYQGTHVTRGRGRAVVVATGSRTVMGQVAGLIGSARPEPTPLQRRLDELGRTLILACTATCAVVVAAGLAAGQPLYVMFLAGVSLAVAAVPEGLPAVITVLLGLGVQRMARRRAVVRRLPAVETLGAVTVICSDKTGTLTENRMRLRQVWFGGQEPPVPAGEAMQAPRMRRFLAVAALASDADPGGQGSPTERALVDAAAEAGVDVARLRRQRPRAGEVPFDSQSKRMVVVCRTLGGWEACVKGAPEVVIEQAQSWWDGRKPRPLTAEDRRRWLERAAAMADGALRVLAVAVRTGVGAPPPPEEAGQEGLVLLGLAGMMDPPRREAQASIERCRAAGIRVIMITGDHRRTAAAVARELGLLSQDPGEDEGDRVLEGADLERMSDDELLRRLDRVRVFARVSPEHKLRIVRLLKDQGHVVAMTGDGVNDAPAVKAADIGVAMGRVGADVTRETADMVLLDDNFATIVAAVEEGRAIYANVRKFVRYILASNTGEILVMLAAMLLGWPLPLLPIHLLFVNLVTDGLPAVALGMEPPERDTMQRPPRRPGESLFAHGLARRILGWGTVIGVVSLGLFAWAAAGGDLARARTVTLASLVLSQMFHVLECRAEGRGSGLVVGANPALVLAIATTVAALAAIVHWPPLAALFRTAPLSPADWLVTTAACAAGYLFMRVRARLLVLAVPARVPPHPSRPR
nr:ATPase [Bacillota bacterium]